MIYSEAMDEFYASPDDVLDCLADTDGVTDNLRLRLCVPVPPRIFDMNEFLVDELPEETYLDTAAIDEMVNAWIAQQGTLSWQPGPYALEVE